MVVSKQIWQFMVTAFSRFKCQEANKVILGMVAAKVSADGAVVTSEGHPLNIGLDNIPAEAINIGIASTGEYTFSINKVKISAMEIFS